MIATTNPETRTYNIGFADGARRMKHELAIENSRVQSENGKLKTENEALRTRNEKLRKYNEILQNKHFRLQHKLKLLRQMLDEPPH